jgi:hypothetical protein
LYSLRLGEEALRGRTDADLKHEVVEKLLERSLLQLGNDAMAAKNLRVPLGCATATESALLQYAGTVSGDIADSIAFELEFPYLSNVPVKDLINIREAESESFEAFRSALRAAVHERAKVSGSSGINALAREIQHDILEPKLAALRASLKRNAISVNRNATTAGVSGFVGVVGLFVPGLQQVGATALGLGAALTLGTLNSLKERDSIKASEMYLLLEPALHR